MGFSAIHVKVIVMSINGNDTSNDKYTRVTVG